MSTTPTPLDLFKSAILTAAADAVLKEMTPEKMRECAEQIIKTTLSDISDARYGALQSQVKDAAEKIMRDYITTPGVQAAIRAAAENGVNAALAGLSAEIRGRVVDIALKGMGNAMSSKDRNY